MHVYLKQVDNPLPFKMIPIQQCNAGVWERVNPDTLYSKQLPAKLLPQRNQPVITFT